MSTDFFVMSDQRVSHVFTCQCTSSHTEPKYMPAPGCRECNGTGIVELERDAHMVNMGGWREQDILTAMGLDGTEHEITPTHAMVDKLERYFPSNDARGNHEFAQRVADLLRYAIVTNQKVLHG